MGLVAFLPVGPFTIASFSLPTSGLGGAGHPLPRLALALGRPARAGLCGFFALFFTKSRIARTTLTRQLMDKEGASEPPAANGGGGGGGDGGSDSGASSNVIEGESGFASATSSPKAEEGAKVVPPSLKVQASPISHQSPPAAPKADAGAWVGRVQGAGCSDGERGSGKVGAGDAGTGSSTATVSSRNGERERRAVAQIAGETLLNERFPMPVPSAAARSNGDGGKPTIQVPRHPTRRSKHLSTVSNSSDEASTTYSPAAATPRRGEDVLMPMAMPQVVVSVSESGAFSEESSAVTSPRSLGRSSRRWADVVIPKGGGGGGVARAAKEPSFRRSFKSRAQDKAAGDSTASLFAAKTAQEARLSPHAPAAPPRTSTRPARPLIAEKKNARGELPRSAGHGSNASARSRTNKSGQWPYVATDAASKLTMTMTMATATTTEASAAAAAAAAAEMGATSCSNTPGGARGRRRSATPRASHDPFLREKMEAKPTFLTLRPCECVCVCVCVVVVVATPRDLSSSPTPSPPPSSPPSSVSLPAYSPLNPLSPSPYPYPYNNQQIRSSSASSRASQRGSSRASAASPASSPGQRPTFPHYLT